MRSPAKSSLFVFLVLFALLVTTACGPKATPAPAHKGDQGSTYKIGFMAAITGSASSLGKPERDAAVMVQKQLDAQGGIVGPTAFDFGVSVRLVLMAAVSRDSVDCSSSCCACLTLAVR